MIQQFRVLRRFQWGGKEYAPKGQCACSTDISRNQIRRELIDDEIVERTQTYTGYAGCTKKSASGCTCSGSERCGRTGGGACGINPEDYGGDIWRVDENHPRKQFMLQRKFATYDIALETIPEEEVEAV